MPSATITLQVLVALDVPAEYAAKVTKDDLVEMARSAIPDSFTAPPHGPILGVQVTVDEVCQLDTNHAPVFADVQIEHDIIHDPDIQFDDEGFTQADPDEHRRT